VDDETVPPDGVDSLFSVVSVVLEEEVTMTDCSETLVPTSAVSFRRFALKCCNGHMNARRLQCKHVNNGHHKMQTQHHLLASFFRFFRFFDFLAICGPLLAPFRMWVLSPMFAIRDFFNFAFAKFSAEAQVLS
jgi:hypothetical protein